jgi:ribosomal protein S18 acetylase RimI-like enzyme
VRVNSTSEPILIDVAAPDSPAGSHALRSYLDDVASRYHGRQATDEEIDAALRDHPSDDLVPPHGLLLLARQATDVLACAGLRLLPDGVGEITRVFVFPAARGRGLGARMVGELERLARAHDRSLLRLDTRSDLVEARRLYARLGYDEVPAFNHGPYADHWFAKSLL